VNLAQKSLTAAKHAQHSAWAQRRDAYDLGPDDAFTDGFWDGRVWALARVLHLIPEDQREAAATLLEIYPRERTVVGLPETPPC
jgi:hypothetical protein